MHIHSHFESFRSLFLSLLGPSSEALIVDLRSSEALIVDFRSFVPGAHRRILSSQASLHTCIFRSHFGSSLNVKYICPYSYKHIVSLLVNHWSRQPFSCAIVQRSTSRRDKTVRHVVSLLVNFGSRQPFSCVIVQRSTSRRDKQ